MYNCVMSNACPKDLVSIEGLEEAAECLRTLAHPHRLRMVQMLLKGEYMVGELADACGIPSHMASEHLRLMKDRGLLLYERRGRCIYYRVAEKGLASIMGCVEKRFGGPCGDNKNGRSR
jgi:ArsR family transcriptional regulator, zinc-responsive transcriptional repressor